VNICNRARERKDIRYLSDTYTKKIDDLLHRFDSKFIIGEEDLNAQITTGNFELA